MRLIEGTKPFFDLRDQLSNLLPLSIPKSSPTVSNMLDLTLNLCMQRAVPWIIFDNLLSAGRRNIFSIILIKKICVDFTKYIFAVDSIIREFLENIF